MTLVHAVQIALLGGLVTLVIERVRALCVLGPLDADAFVRAIRSAPEERKRALIERGGRAFVAQVLAPWVLEVPADRDIATEEALVDAKRAILERLQWVRVGGTLASLFGFVGAAIALGSIYYGDHQGLEALDPTRMQRRALGEAALSIALGVGGSAFALGSWATLRGHAKRLVADCDRAVDRLRAR